MKRQLSYNKYLCRAGESKKTIPAEMPEFFLAQCGQRLLQILNLCIIIRRVYFMVDKVQAP